jgi:hypothetical protein
MAYFKLAEQTQLTRYVCDYHSHFTGILPTQRKRLDDEGASLAQLLAQRCYPGDAHRLAKGELKLFDYALSLMIDSKSNPFARLLAKQNRADYERAECVAENLYIACQVLAANAGYLPEELALPPQSPALYSLVGREIVAPALASAAGPDVRLRELVRYFNNKLYSANKYTPFDDAYKLRGHFVKQLCQGDPAKYDTWNEAQKNDYQAWANATFDYLREDGVLLTQSAATEDEIPQLARLAQAYNTAKGTDYRLLVHTPHHYMAKGELASYLDAKVRPLLVGEGSPVVVGLDLLGAENKVGNYAELFKWLQANVEALGANFGDDGEGKRARRMIVHIHCGEGSGFGAENRSVIGYYFHEAGDPDPAFYAALSAHVLDACGAAYAKRSNTVRGTRGTAIPQALFEELFANTAFSHAGHVLRRFDINAPLSRELAGYNAKRNVMALSEALDLIQVPFKEDYYRNLVEENPLYAFRLGHDYYYRSYMVSRYPWLAFDTNLGSNAITGASAQFDSVHGYRLNRGYRHLDGYIDTDVLNEAGNAVLSMDARSLSSSQIARFIELSRSKDDLPTTLQKNRDFLLQQLKGALGPIKAAIPEEALFATYCLLTEYCAGEQDVAALRYQAMVRVLQVFQNWRSYLLGADGQGVEHTGVQHEFLRMLVLLVYKMLLINQGEIPVAVLQALAALLQQLARGYWTATIGPLDDLQDAADPLGLESLDGFKGPASVVVVRRTPPAQP